MKRESQSGTDGFVGRGTFWLPQAPKRAVPGELRASFDDISLQLDDSLMALAGSPFESGPDSHPRVLGVVDGRPVTLESCFNRGSYVVGLALRTRGERYGVLRAAIGAHVEDIRVQEVRISFDGLRAWAPPPRPIITHHDGEGHAGVRATYTEPETVTVSLPLGDVVLSWFGAWEAGTEFSVRPDTLVTVRLSRPLGLEEFLESIVTPLRSLVALGLSTPCPLTSLSADIAPDAVITATRPVDLYFLASGQAPRDERKQTKFFGFEDVRAQFAEVLPRWLAYWGSMRTVCALFFAHLFTPSPHVEARFLFACQAAELLHGTVGDAHVRPKAELKALVKELTKALPDKHKGWVTNALFESNRKALRQQLLELVDDAPASVRASIGDAEAFAALVTRTRHAYTHWTARDDAATGGPLLALTLQLRLLVQARLMRGIGMENVQIDSLVERSGVAREIAHWQTAAPIA